MCILTVNLAIPFVALKRAFVVFAFLSGKGQLAVLFFALKRTFLILSSVLERTINSGFYFCCSLLPLKRH